MNPLSQEPDPRTVADTGQTKQGSAQPRRPPSTWGEIVMAIFVGATVVIYIVLTCISIKTLRVDQRAWVSVPIPPNFPLTGTSIPAVTQITNSGKTPAKDVQGDVVATVLKKGENPALGDFSVGHPHNRVYAGTIFPGAPVPTTITVVHYGPTASETIVPDDTLRQDIANGNRFIIFYGRITYYDVFGVRHWTQFCTGSGTAILDNLKQCISYNDVDRNEE